jgi:hypothetical protein
MNYYVADAESYRLVPHEKIVTVFPKQDEPQKASFINHFSDEQLAIEDIRYLFPEGCELPFECVDKCCEKNRAEIILPTTDSSSCCKEVSKLVIPIDLSEIKKIPLEEINLISSEVDPAKMLLKLLRLIEKVREEKAV